MESATIVKVEDFLNQCLDSEQAYPWNKPATLLANASTVKRLRRNGDYMKAAKVILVFLMEP